MILLDTHVWIWWASSPDKLSEQARTAINKGVSRNAIAISSISCWEIAMLVQRKRLEFDRSVLEWLAASEAQSFITFVPVTNQIAVESAQLPGSLHQDPADRMIMATARINRWPLVTCNAKIRDYGYINTVW